MAKTEQDLIERMAFHIADEAGQLGHHEERWYNAAQRNKYLKQAKDVITLLRNDGFVVCPRDRIDALELELAAFKGAH